MHIEPGYIAAYKVAYANIAAISTLGYFAAYAIKKYKLPIAIIAKSLLAAFFFSIFMELFYSTQVGPSELHFVGAMVIYFTLGFLPTLFGFAIGLLLQGMIFNPADLIHLSVNTLSLIIPLCAVHYLAKGKQLFDETISIKLNWQKIMRFDAVYYGGVVGMVGFWLAVGDSSTAFSSWVKFASSYMIIILIEPFLTWSILKLLKSLETKISIINKLFITKKLTVA